MNLEISMYNFGLSLLVLEYAFFSLHCYFTKVWVSDLQFVQSGRRGTGIG